MFNWLRGSVRGPCHSREGASLYSLPQGQLHIHGLFTVFAETTIHSTLFPMGPVHIYAMRVFGKVQGLFFLQEGWCVFGSKDFNGSA